jgi:uncharacterized membrane protein YdjX (TVP38/TMEM64 family)
MKKIVLLVVVAIAVLIAWRTGIFEAFRDPERVKALLLAWGPWGRVVYVVSFALIEPLGVPGLVFVIPAGMIWPTPEAFALSLLGSVLAGSVGFGFARFLARDWVERRLPARFRRFDELLARRGLEAVILVRVVFFLAPPAHWVLGLSKVRYSAFLLGSAIGFVPGIAALTFLGAGLVEWLLLRPWWTWALIVCVIGAIVVAQCVLTRRAVPD